MQHERVRMYLFPTIVEPDCGTLLSDEQKPAVCKDKGMSAWLSHNQACLDII